MPRVDDDGLPLYKEGDEVELETESGADLSHSGPEEEAHAHRLVLVEEADYGFTVYWCPYCGTLFRFLDGGKYAELVPEWSRPRLKSMDRRKVIRDYVTGRVRPRKLRKVSARKAVLEEDGGIKMDELFERVGTDRDDEDVDKSG